MKVGKVPENVLKRSVFKQLHTTRKEVLLRGRCGRRLRSDEISRG